jgi:hypothetical protein
MPKTSLTPPASDSSTDNVLSLEALRHRFPRRNRRLPRLATQAEAGRSYPSLYIFPVWNALRDSVGG